MNDYLILFLAGLAWLAWLAWPSEGLTYAGHGGVIFCKFLLLLLCAMAATALIADVLVIGGSLRGELL